MLQQKNSLLIYLVHGRLTAYRVSGDQVIGIVSEPLRGYDWNKLWDEGLIPLDQPLTRLIRQLGLNKNVHATLVYQSPDSSGQIVQVDGDAGDAEQIARLGFLSNGSSADPDADLVCDTLVLSKDSTTTRVLVCGDLDRNAQTAYAWVSRAGGKNIRLVTAQEVETILAAKCAKDQPECGTVVVHVSEGTTIIACGGQGKLESIRAMRFGFGLLREACAMVLAEIAEEQGQDENSSQIEGVFSLGIPSDKNAVDPALARRLLPRLQPVLQRYTIEIKQTLRFGIPRGLGAPSSIVLSGEGSRIPGLSEHLMLALDLHEVRPDPNWAESEFGDSNASFVARALHTSGANLVPRLVAAQTVSRRIGMATLAGLAIAGGILLSGGILKASDRARANAEVEALSVELSGLQESHAKFEAAGEVWTTLQTRAGVVRESLFDLADWDAVLLEVARIAQQSGVSVLSIESQTSAEGSEMKVACLSTLDQAAPRVFLESLGESPHIGQVSLGSKTALSDGTRFEASFIVVPALSRSERIPTTRLAIGDTP